MPKRPERDLLEAPAGVTHAGKTYSTPGYLALARYAADLGQDGIEVEVRFSSHYGKDMAEITNIDGSRVLYASEIVNRDLVREHIFIVKPGDNSEPRFIMQMADPAKFDENSQYMSIDSGTEEPFLPTAGEMHMKLVSLFERVMGYLPAEMKDHIPGQQEEVAYIYDERMPEQDDIPIDVDLPPHLLEKIGREFEEDTEPMRIPTHPPGIRWTSLSEISCLVNPVTNEHYSESFIKNLATMTLASCMDDLITTQYDILIAIPPQRRTSLAIEFGRRKNHAPYLGRQLTPMTPGQRQRIVRLLGPTFRRKDLPEEVKNAQEEYFMMSGPKIISMDRLCTELADSIRVYELKEVTPENLLRHVFPRSGTAAFYTQSDDVIAQLVDHVRARRLEDGKFKAYPDRNYMTAGELTIAFVGESPRKTFKKVIQGTDLDALIDLYLDITDPEKAE